MQKFRLFVVKINNVLEGILMAKTDFEFTEHFPNSFRQVSALFGYENISVVFSIILF